MDLKSICAKKNHQLWLIISKNFSPNPQFFFRKPSLLIIIFKINCFSVIRNDSTNAWWRNPRWISRE